MNTASPDSLKTVDDLPPDTLLAQSRVNEQSLLSTSDAVPKIWIEDEQLANDKDTDNDVSSVSSQSLASMTSRTLVLSSAPKSSFSSFPSSHDKRINSLLSQGGGASISGGRRRVNSDGYLGFQLASMGSNNNTQETPGTLGSNSISEIVDGTGRNVENLQVPGSVNIKSKPTAVTGTGGGFKPPTLRDIPPVTLTKITKVKKAEFSKYLSDIGSVFDRYCYIKGLSADSFIKPMISDEETEKAINSNQYEPRRVSLSSSPSNSGLATPSSVSSAALAPLTTVPSVFFDDDFQLDNPRVFDVVSENASVVRHDAETPTRKVLANNAILQEKLSWYVDTVEIHLIDEISKASETFFSTLDELREIHADSEHTVERIQNLRNDLNALDQRQAVSGIKSLKLLQRKQNIDKLQQSLNQISLVMNLADNAETLYLESKLNACVDLIDTTESLIQGQNSFHLDSLSFPGLDLDKDIADWKAPLVDLRSVQGLSELRESLCVLRTNAGRKYSSNFVDILLNDIDLHLDSVSQQSTLKRMLQVLDKKSNRSQSTMMSENNTSCYSIVSDVFRKSLVENINGLFRSNLISDAFKSYRETVMKKARDIIKANLPSNGDDDNESISSSISLSSKFGGGRSAAERSMNLATRLRTLTSADFESFLIKVYTGLSELLRRLSIHQKLLLDTISSIPRILEEDPSLMMVINTRELIDEVIESTHDRIVRVINVRRDQISLCTLDQFLRFYVLNGIFLSECEAISGSVGMKLQSVINNQVRQFMAPYLKDQNKTIVTLLETDKWKDEEVPPELQQELDDIYASATNDPSSWTSALKNSLMSSLTDGESNNENVDDDKPSVKLSTKQRPRNVFVDTSSFIIPGGMIQIIPIIGEMLQLIVHFPYLSLEIINQVLEVLKCINITTNSLILKTGATKTAGLKHITAKHLALASQSLDLIITLIPYMREYCRRHLPASFNVGSNSTSLTTSASNSSSSISSSYANTNTASTATAASSAGIKLLNQFNEIRSQLADHQQEIYTKFSTIMSDRLNGHINAIIKLDCSQLAKTSTTTATEIANTYMQVLCKETNTMAKVLVKFLPKAIYLDIIKRIFDNYETKLLASYQQLPITNATERAVIIRDVDYFIESLSPIEGTDSCGQVLKQGVNSIKVEDDDVTTNGDVHDNIEAVPDDHIEKNHNDDNDGGNTLFEVDHNNDGGNTLFEVDHDNFVDKAPMESN